MCVYAYVCGCGGATMNDLLIFYPTTSASTPACVWLTAWYKVTLCVCVCVWVSVWERVWMTVKQMGQWVLIVMEMRASPFSTHAHTQVFVSAWFPFDFVSALSTQKLQNMCKCNSFNFLTFFLGGGLRLLKPTKLQKSQWQIQWLTLRLLKPK